MSDDRHPFQDVPFGPDLSDLTDDEERLLRGILAAVRGAPPGQEDICTTVLVATDDGGAELAWTVMLSRDPEFIQDVYKAQREQADEDPDSTTLDRLA